MPTATNTLITPLMITAQFLAILHQKLNFVGSINRQYDSSFAREGAKIGDTLRIRLPVQYTVASGPTLAVQNTIENYVPLVISSQKHVDMAFSSAELALKIQDFSERYIEPAAAVLAANVEADALSMANSVWNVIDGHGSPQTMKNILAARKKLVDNLAPFSKQWQLRVNTQDNVDVVSANMGLFHQSTQIARQYTEGVMGLSGGFEWAENTFLTTYTRGAQSGYLVGGAGQTGSTLAVTTGTGAGNAGDVFTIAGVNAVHGETKANTGVLQQFVLTAPATAGAGNWSIAPPIVTSGSAQNVSASPGAGAAITFVGVASTATGQSLAYAPDAFTFATADLVMPGGVDMAARVQKDGLSLRMVRQYDINNDNLPARVDILYGYVAMRPQLACRLFAN